MILFCHWRSAKNSLPRRSKAKSSLSPPYVKLSWTIILFTPTSFLESNYARKTAKKGSTCAFQKLFVCRAGREGQKEMLMAGAPLLHKRSGQLSPSNLLQSKHRDCQSIRGVFWLGLSNLHPPPNEMMVSFLCSSLNGRDESCLFINLTKVLLMFIVCSMYQSSRTLAFYCGRFVTFF